MTPPTAAELRSALDVVLRALSAALATPQPVAGVDPDAAVDLKSSGYYRAALAAIKGGTLPARRIPGARAFVVTRRDFDRWRTSPEFVVRPAVTAPSEVDTLIGQANAKRERRLRSVGSR